jgi:hypothetical protein
MKLAAKIRQLKTKKSSDSLLFYKAPKTKLEKTLKT